VAVWATDPGATIAAHLTVIAFLAVIVPVLEEIVFRWVLFYFGIVFLTGLNHLTVEVVGLGVPSWIFIHVGRPVASFCTFGYARALLYNPVSWAVGAAALASNGRFRNGHSYQGPLGWTWSWYMGMFLFAIMYQYGLFMAMILHALYNLLGYATSRILFLTATRKAVY
jgi:hypothetical protein